MESYGKIYYKSTIEKERYKMSVDYSTLSITELNATIEEAQAALKEKKEDEKKEFRNEILELVQSRGFSMEELFNIEGKPKKKGKLPPTHRDPNDPRNTWTGRGRKPLWLAEALNAGGEMKDYIIS